MLFDIRIVDTDAWSHRARSPHDVLGLAEVEKKRKYLKAYQDGRDTFTPLCVSVDGMLGSEAEFFVKRMSNFLAARWERPYSVVMGWVRACFSIAILPAELLCVRGSRTKWRNLRIVDGTSLPIMMLLINPFVFSCVFYFVYNCCWSGFCGVTLSYWR